MLEIGINTQVLLFAFGVALLTSLVFGLAPALRLARHELVADLKEGGRSAGSGPRHRARNVLVVAEDSIL